MGFAFSHDSRPHGLFDVDVDYGQIVKFYDDDPIGPGRSALPQVTGAERVVIAENPYQAHISTSHIERHKPHRAYERAWTEHLTGTEQMKPYLLKLKFENPDIRSTGGSSWIIPGDHRRDEDDWPLLTPHCGTLGEIEWHIDRMQAELEELRREARKKYAAAKGAPIELGL